MIRKYHSVTPTHGFSLIELLVTLSIAVILMVVAEPSFQSVIVNNRLTTAANDILLGLNMAKSEAIHKNTSIRFCVNPTTRAWRVATTADVDIRLGSVPDSLAMTSANLDTTSVTGQACVRFRPDGLSYGSATTLMTAGSMTLTLDGKSRVINVKTGTLYVVNS